MTTTTELLQAAVNMADDHKAAAYLANGTVADLRGRINRARQQGTNALYNYEAANIEALSKAIHDMLQELEGDR